MFKIKYAALAAMFLSLGSIHSAVAGQDPESLLEDRVKIQITLPTCSERKEFISKTVIEGKTDISRRDVLKVLKLYILDCFDNPYALRTAACRNSRSEVIGPFRALIWDHFSSRCDVAASPDGNAEADLLVCEKYIDGLISGEIASPGLDLKALAENPDLGGLAGAELARVEKANGPEAESLNMVLKGYLGDCYCGNGQVDHMEECDPGMGYSRTCNADCTFTLRPKIKSDLIKRLRRGTRDDFWWNRDWN